MSGQLCPFCGHENPGGSRFCSSCGQPLSRLEHTTAAHIIDPELLDEAADMASSGGLDVSFVVVRGEKSGSRYAIDRDLMTIGRHPDSDIFLDDITVSRRHAEVEKIDDSFVVRDVGSLNGTYLNRQRVEQAGLTSGDEVQVGKFKLVFVQADAE